MPPASNMSDDLTAEVAPEKPKSQLARIARRILIVFGTFLVGMTLLALWGIRVQANYEKTAVPYLREQIPIITTWEADKFLALFDSRIRDEMDPDRFEKVMSYYANLGELEWLGEPEFRNITAYAGTDGGAMKRVTYAIPARFEAGEARFDITLVDHKGEFSIYHFNINSEVFKGLVQLEDTGDVESDDDVE